MPKKLDRCVKKLIEQGHSEDSAWAICNSSIKKGVKMKKATVLKSMRTQAGAEDWARLMENKYPNLRVVDTETLKSFGGIMPAPLPPSGHHHVIMEEDISPVVNIIKKSDVGEIVKAMVSKGFMKIDKFGPCLTAKWHDMIDDFVSQALQSSLKSVSELEYNFDGEVSEEDAAVINALFKSGKLAEYSYSEKDRKDGVLSRRTADGTRTLVAHPDKTGHFGERDQKADDYIDAKRTAKKSAEAPENDEFGHALRDNESISDEEASSAFENDAKDVDTRDPEMDGEAISDAEVRNNTLKSVDPYLFTTFKSVDDARSWRNPDMGVYQVVPVSASERGTFGEDAKYVVRARHEWYEASVLKSIEADKRTQGLTSPESASDDGGTKDVEARAKKVDSLKGKKVDPEVLKSVIDETLEELLGEE